MRFLVHTVALVLMALPAYAQSDDMKSLSEADFIVSDTADLVEICSVEAGHAHYDSAYHFCVGYVAGVFGSLVSLRDDPSVGEIVCPTADVTLDDGVEVFTDWAKSKPDRLRSPAVGSLVQAWEARYPC